MEQLNSYLEKLPVLFQSPKANSATKLVMPFEDADLMMHLLKMCCIKCQWQYDLMETSTPVSTRALLLVLENIESNVELDDKPTSKDMAKGTDCKEKMETSDIHNSKKAKKARQRSTVLSARNMGAHTSHTTPRSAGAITSTDTTRRQAGCPNQQASQ